MENKSMRIKKLVDYLYLKSRFHLSHALTTFTILNTPQVWDRTNKE